MALDLYREKHPSLKFYMLDERILRITISNPQRRNAVTSAMHTDLTNVWKTVDTDRDVDVVLIEGDGSIFSGGADFDFLVELRDNLDARMRVCREGKDLVYNMIDCAKPIVSAVRGAAFGAGLVVAVMADLSVVARDAKLVEGHTRIGLATGDHAVISWPLLMGMAKAKWFLLTNEVLTGEIANQLGLVSTCVDDEQVHETALKAARSLAAGSASAIRWSKQSLNHWYRQAAPAFEASLGYEFIGFGMPDFSEGIAALREQRPPKFKGPRCE